MLLQALIHKALEAIKSRLFAALGALSQALDAGCCQLGQSGIGRADDSNVGGVIQFRQVAAVRSLVGIALYQRS